MGRFPPRGSGFPRMSTLRAGSYHRQTCQRRSYGTRHDCLGRQIQHRSFGSTATLGLYSSWHHHDRRRHRRPRRRRVRDDDQRQTDRLDSHRCRRLRDRSRLLDQGMGRIPVAGPARCALCGIRPCIAHPAGFRRSDLDLSAWRVPARIVCHSMHPEFSPLGPERMG
jgi:hypothetical protein